MMIFFPFQVYEIHILYNIQKWYGILLLSIKNNFAVMGISQVMRNAISVITRPMVQLFIYCLFFKGFAVITVSFRMIVFVIANPVNVVFLKTFKIKFRLTNNSQIK